MNAFNENNSLLFYDLVVLNTTAINLVQEIKQKLNDEFRMKYIKCVYE